MERIVLAYSGSNDDSFAIPMLARAYSAEIVTLTLDVGQNQELEEVRDRSLAVGAVRAHVLDARDEFAREFVLPALQAGALRHGGEPTAFPLAHALIGKKLVEIALIEEASTVAHQGGGHDCRRIETSVRALNPSLRVLVLGDPHERMRTRTNLWGRSVDYDACGNPYEPLYSWTKSPETAPDTGADLEIGFDRGVPTTVNGVPLDLGELIDSLSIIAGRHGVGRIPSIETGSGTMRRVHEAPAAIVLHAAHEALEVRTGGHDDASLKRHIRRAYADLIVRGLWFTPLRAAVDAFNAVVQSQVNGAVRLQLFKGSWTIADVRAAGLGSPILESSLVVSRS